MGPTWELCIHVQQEVPVKGSGMSQVCLFPHDTDLSFLLPYVPSYLEHGLEQLKFILESCFIFS